MKEIEDLQERQGCSFSSLCPSVKDRCHIEIPELKEVEKGHSVACFKVF